MFLVLNLLNLPSFLLSFMCFFQFYFSCLQVFIKQFFKFLFAFVTHAAPSQKEYPAEMTFLQQMPPAHIPKSCLFSEKAFLRTRHLSSHVFSTFSVTLGREKTYVVVKYLQ